MNKMINGLGSLFQTNGKSQANKIEINYLIYQHSQTEVCQRRTHNSENKVCCKKRKFLESKRRKKTFCFCLPINQNATSLTTILQKLNCKWSLIDAIMVLGKSPVLFSHK